MKCHECEREVECFMISVDAFEGKRLLIPMTIVMVSCLDCDAWYMTNKALETLRRSQT